MRRAQVAERRVEAVEQVLDEQVSWCAEERLDVPSWVATVRTAIETL